MNRWATGLVTGVSIRQSFNMRLDTLSSAENLGVEVGTLRNVIGQITDAGILNVHKMLAYKQGGLSHVIITCT